jgi:hypothetical protein
MSDREEGPDPNIKIEVVACLTPQEAALLAGRLEAEGIKAMVSIGHSAPGRGLAFSEWAAQGLWGTSSREEGPRFS